ncbi:MAG: hypothetical protein ACLTKI_05440 [Lachnospiraceae bacterium]
MERMKFRFRGSYTVEAAFIMAMVLQALVILLQMAFYLHDRTAGTMILHEGVEIVRHGEEGVLPEQVEKISVEKMGLRMSGDRFEVAIQETLEGWHGNAGGERWEAVIQAKTYEPESFLRVMGVLEEGEETWKSFINGK